MRTLFGAAVAASLLLSMPVKADSYCIWIRSRVTGEWKIHRCSWFNEYQQCVDAAKRVDGVCKAK